MIPPTRHWMFGPLAALSLAATLKAGRVVAERGVLASASGGVLVVAAEFSCLCVLGSGACELRVRRM